jgi:hypothetical protein
MRVIILGAALIAIVVATGFICVDEHTWQSLRVAWITFAGLGLGAGISLVSIGMVG